MARLLTVCAFLFLIGCTHAANSPTPQVVNVPSGSLTLKALLWVPDGPRRLPAVLFNHGRPDKPDEHLRKRSAYALGPMFARHGYVFLYLFRRGEGLSMDKGTFIGEALAREELRAGKDARQRLQLRLLTTDHLSDGLAGLAFLRRHSRVDSGRIALAGHSFGGQLALLEAEREPSVRAIVTFGAAAGSWSGSRELRTRMLATTAAIQAPVLILHAANDYSLEPGLALDAELTRLGKPHALKIYPPIGQTAADGHSFVYLAPDRWEADVFAFLDESIADDARQRRK
jgi:dienelactone hydrolase